MRRCRLRDVAQVSDMLKASWRSAHERIVGTGASHIFSKFNLAMWVAQCFVSSRVWAMPVATCEGKIAGCAMTQLDGDEIVLYLLYVHPDWQGQGVGSTLLAAAIAKHPTAKAMRLEVLKDNAPAIAWYKSKGFQVYGDTKYATGTSGIAALYMDKALGRAADSSAG